MPFLKPSKHTLLAPMGWFTVHIPKKLEPLIGKEKRNFNYHHVPDNFENWNTAQTVEGLIITPIDVNSLNANKKSKTFKNLNQYCSEFGLRIFGVRRSS